jgi:hypothetical protein
MNNADAQRLRSDGRLLDAPTEEVHASQVETHTIRLDRKNIVQLLLARGFQVGPDALVEVYVDDDATFDDGSECYVRVSWTTPVADSEI